MSEFHQKIIDYRNYMQDYELCEYCKSLTHKDQLRWIRQQQGYLHKVCSKCVPFYGDVECAVQSIIMTLPLK
jgi:hypothetical protein